jgi:hypothetical protein
MSELPDVLTYLHRIKQLYPTGVPVSPNTLSPSTKLNNPITAPSFSSTPKLIFIREVQASESLVQGRDQQDEVLASAITKGLKLALDEVAVVSCSSKAPTALGELLTEYKNTPVVVLGSNLAAQLGIKRVGELLEIDGVMVLATVSLDHVIGSTEQKRTFWNHLQLILKELDRR